MALTPERIAQLRGDAGLSPTPPKQGVEDVLASRRKALGMSDVPEPSLTYDNSFMGSLMGKAAPTPYDKFVSEGPGIPGQKHIQAAVDNPREFGKGILKSIPDMGRAIDTGIQKIGAAVANPITDTLGLPRMEGIKSLTPGTPEYENVEQITAPQNDAQEAGAFVGSLLPAERAVSAVKPVVKGVVEAVGKKLAERSVMKTEKKVLDTIVGKDAEMSKAMKQEAIEQGRKTETKGFMGTQKVEYSPTKEIEHASTILNKEGVLKGGEVPTVVKEKIEKVIATKGQEAEKYLAANPKQITNQEHSQLFNNLKQEASLRDDREAAVNAYDSLINNFTQRLVGKGGYTTENYYKALKEWERDIGPTLPHGKDALIGDATGISSGRARAANDIRQAVRGMIGEKNPEFTPQMYDLMSLYRAKDQAVYNALKFEKQNIFQKYPKTTAAVGTAIPVAGATVGIMNK